VYSRARDRYDPATAVTASLPRMKWVLLAAAIVAVVYFVRTRRNGR
jgi:hypothetical protein